MTSNSNTPRETKGFRACKKSGEYHLYKIDGGYELWYGVYSLDEYDDKGVRVGYVADPDNFEYAVAIAQEEMRSLVAGF